MHSSFDQNEAASGALGEILDSLSGGSLADRGRLVRACQIIRAHGVRSVATPEVRAAARLAESAAAGSPAAGHLVKRLAQGGVTMAADYHLYIATDILATWRPGDPPDVILAATARAGAERIEIMLRLPELRGYEGREKLNHMGERAIQSYRHVAFGPGPVPAADPLVIEAAFLPETALQDELVFMSVTQVCETIFQGVAEVLRQAELDVAYARARRAAVAMTVAERALSLLQQAGGVLSCMTIERWLNLRNYIELPSAIQSVSYQAMQKAIWNITRLIGHARYAEWEAPFAGEAAVALLAVTERVHRWESLHLGLAKKYAGTAATGVLPVALEYLDRQIADLRGLIADLKKRYAT